MTYELRAFDLTTGDYLADLTAYTKATLGFNIGAMDAGMSLEYPTNAAGASYLVNDIEIRLYADDVQVDDGAWVVRGSQGDMIPDKAALKVAGRHITDVYRKLLLYPEVSGTDSKAWDANPGQILKDCLDLGADRGAFAATSFDYSTFDGTHDSNGQPWPTQFKIGYKWGTTFLAILNHMYTRGWITVRMVGRSLRVYQGLDSLGAHRDIILAGGANLTESPYKRSTEDRITHLVVEGDEGVYVERTVPGPRREEGFVSQSGTKDVGTLSVVGDNMLTSLGIERDQRTVKVARNWAIQPGKDFKTGDWLVLDADVTEEMRVRTVSLELDREGFTSSIVLNDRILEGEIARAIRAESVTTGVTPGSVGTPKPIPVDGSKDATVPSKPTGLAVATDAYVDSRGLAWAVANLSWAAPATNTDGSPITDLAGYRVWMRDDSDLASWELIGDTQNTEYDASGLTPSKPVRFSVQAYDQSNHFSAFSDELTILLANDTTPPPAPSAPTVQSILSVLRVLWNGQVAGGGSMPADFDHIEVLYSTVNDFAVADGTLLDTLSGAGVTIAAGLTTGIPYYFKFVAVDRSGNRSALSVQGTGTPTKVSGIDLATGSIGYDAIGFKDFDNLVPDGSFENPAIDTQRTYDAAWSYVTDPATAFHRDRFIRGNGASSPSTYRTFYLTGHIDVRPGDQFFVRCAYRRSVGANGTMKVTAEAYNSAGVMQWDGIFILGTINGNWTEVSTAYTPAADIERVRFYVEMAFDVTAGLNDLDAVEIRHVMGTALIQDAAIARAKIQDLAVDNAKIGDLDGGKIWAQSISAEELKVGTLGRNLVPNSSFEDDYGWTLTPYAAQGVGYYDGQAGVAYSGSRALVSGATAVVGGENHGMTFRSDWFPVKPGASYRQQVFARASVVMGNGLYMRMEWADDLTGVGATGAVINEIEAKGCGTTYQEFSQEYTAPAGKNAARMYLHHYNPNVTCNLWFDDAAVVEIGVGASQLTAAGLKVWDVNGDLVIDMTYKPLGFGNTFAIMKAGSPVASIDSDGRVNASEVFTDKITLGGADLDGTLDTKAGGVVTSSFTWPLTGTATARKGLGELSFMHKPDRNYRVIFNGIQVQSSIAGDRALVSMRYTIDGSTPTVSNGIIADGIIKLCQVAGNGYSVPPMIIMGNFVPGVVNDTLVRILITIERFSGSGTLTYNTYSSADPHRKPFRLFVEDIGFDVPDTFLANDGGVSAPAGSKTRYTKTYNASWSQTYQSDNDKNTVSGNDAYQGYYSGTNGNQKALIGFPAQVQADLGAGTVEKCEVYLYFFHWYNNSGGTAIIGTHGNTAEPATAPAAGFNRVQSPSWPKPGGRWVNLGTAIGSEFKSSGTTRGITLGPGPSSGSLYYGKAYGATGAYPAKLRITYVK